MRFSCRKKWGGVGLQDLLPRFACTDAIRRTFFGITITKKEGVVEVAEGVILVGPQ